MRRLVVNADDFGLSPGINEGILEAHASAIVTSKSLTERACHPGRVNGDFGSRYLHEREVELATLTEPGLAAEIESLGVELVSFHAWKQLTE